MNFLLEDFLWKHRDELKHMSPARSPSSYYRHRRWRIRDRLSEQDIADIIRAFKCGIAKHVLAKRYSINERSLKKLLREEGVKRKSWGDIDVNTNL